MYLVYVANLTSYALRTYVAAASSRHVMVHAMRTAALVAEVPMYGKPSRRLGGKSLLLLNIIHAIKAG